MKPDSKQLIKKLMLQALQQYFEQSGINEILITLYQNKSRQGNTGRVQNILQSNKAVSKTQQLKQKYGNQLLMNPSDIPVPGVMQEVKIRPQVKVLLNENLDSITSGQSLLDNVESLPAFLKRGLGKLQGR